MGYMKLDWDDPRAVIQRAKATERQRRHRGGKATPIQEIKGRARRDFRFAPVWVLPLPARDFIRSLVEEEKLRDPGVTVLHLCCGSWIEPGWRNVDQVETKAAKGSPHFFQGNVFEVPANSAGVIVADPPFPWPLDYRQRFNQVVTRALGDGGLFILNAPWFPVAPGLAMGDCWGWIRSRPAGSDAGAGGDKTAGGDCSNVVLISTARKLSSGDAVQV